MNDEELLRRLKEAIDNPAKDKAKVVPDECGCGMWSFRHSKNECPGVSG
jgi:hypothetical protein